MKKTRNPSGRPQKIRNRYRYLEQSIYLWRRYMVEIQYRRRPKVGAYLGNPHKISKKISVFAGFFRGAKNEPQSKNSSEGSYISIYSISITDLHISTFWNFSKVRKRACRAFYLFPLKFFFGVPTKTTFSGNSLFYAWTTKRDHGFTCFKKFLFLQVKTVKKVQSNPLVLNAKYPKIPKKGPKIT